MSDSKKGKRVYCFVHAPNTDGWSGEVVLILAKDTGGFKLADIQKVVAELYPEDDPDSFHYDQNVTPNHVSSWFERRDAGMMQRRSAYGTLEDMHMDEWKKKLSAKYPDLFFLMIHKEEE